MAQPKMKETPEKKTADLARPERLPWRALSGGAERILLRKQKKEQSLVEMTLLPFAPVPSGPAREAEPTEIFLG
jgi:hypothetical protein